MLGATPSTPGTAGTLALVAPPHRQTGSHHFGAKGRMNSGAHCLIACGLVLWGHVGGQPLLRPRIDCVMHTPSTLGTTASTLGVTRGTLQIFPSTLGTRKVPRVLGVVPGGHLKAYPVGGFGDVGGGADPL
uniref:Uncharacterized protein n=1 Tax=Eutreptiella gymnastica TaxID=73025 RepID=A0A7S1J6U0_9EUGL|mmetsp:Transcript_71774/g.126407  ORF Transcript_71774/g.126407 Transcript_71774/m.126407 type:complete len:131 (+) Transcript_71774:65-457(+)